MRSHLLFIPFLLIIFSCGEHGYYVSSSGDDSNPGTQSEPFRTIARVNGLKLKPGGSVFFEGGNTFEGTLDLRAEGTGQDSIVISSFGDVPATIDGRNGEAIIIRGAYFSIRDIKVKGAGRKTGNKTNGISLIDAAFATVKNVHTEGFQKSGLDLYNCHDVVVRDVMAVDNGFSGINVSGSDKSKSGNILIQDCHAENNAGDPTALGNHSGNGILVAMSDSVVIDHCTATNNGWDMPRIGNGPVGIWAFETNNLTIQYCISYRNKTPKGAKDGGGFDFDGGVTNSVLQYCLSYENDGAGYGLFQYDGASPWNNNVVRYCISINDAKSTEGSGGIFVWNGSVDSAKLSNCYVHNNLVYSTHAPAVRFEASSLHQNFVFNNNIFIGNGDVVKGPSSGEKFRGNVWWSTEKITFRGYPSLNDWAMATTQEMLAGKITGMQVDPALNGLPVISITNPYKLSSLEVLKLRNNSPLIDSGWPLDRSFKIPLPTEDFFGTPVPQNKMVEPGVFEMPAGRNN